MICEECHGTGSVTTGTFQFPPPDGPLHDLREPCPNCNGSGVQSCCDGATGRSDEVVNEGK